MALRRQRRWTQTGHPGELGFANAGRLPDQVDNWPPGEVKREQVVSPVALREAQAPVIVRPDDIIVGRNISIVPIEIQVLPGITGADVFIDVLNLPSGLVYSREDNRITGIPDQVGSWVIRIIANNGLVVARPALFTMSVVDEDAPRISEQAALTFAQGETISGFEIVSTDPRGRIITATVTGLPQGLSAVTVPGSVARTTISGTVDDAATIQNYPVVLTADNGVTTSRREFTISITAKVADTILTNPGNKTYRQGEHITAFDITVTNTAGSSLNIVTSGLPSGLDAAVSGSAGNYTVSISGRVSASAAVRANLVTVTATGGSAVATVTFVITVGIANRLPVISDPGTRTVRQGSSLLSFNINTTDADEDTLTITVAGAPTGITDSTTGSAGRYVTSIGGSIAKTLAIGDYAVTVTANDGHGTTTRVFTITVLPEIPVNFAPTIAPIADLVLSQGARIGTAVPITGGIPVSISDAEGEAISIRAVGLPPGVSISNHPLMPDAGYFIFGIVSASAIPRVYTCSLFASDGVSTSRRNFNITVVAASEITLTMSGAITATVGDDIQASRDAQFLPFSIDVLTNADVRTLELLVSNSFFFRLADINGGRRIVITGLRVVTGTRAGGRAAIGRITANVGTRRINVLLQIGA